MRVALALLLMSMVGGCLGAPQLFIPASSRVIRIVHDERAVSTSSLRTGAAAAPVVMLMQPIFHMVHTPIMLTIPGHFVAFAPPNSQKLLPSMNLEPPTVPQLPQVPIIKKPELPQVPTTGKKLLFNVYGEPPVFQ